MSADTTAIPRVGDPFPDVSLPSLEGGELQVSSLRGKKVLLFM